MGIVDISVLTDGAEAREVEFACTSTSTVQDLHKKVSEVLDIPAYTQLILYQESFLAHSVLLSAFVPAFSQKKHVKASLLTSWTSSVISVCEHGDIKFWNTQTYDCYCSIKSHKKVVNSIDLSANGKYILTSSADHTAKVWLREAGDCKCTFHGHSDIVNTAVFSSQATHVLTASSDRTVKLWSVENGMCVQTCKIHSAEVNSAGFLQGQEPFHILTASNDRTANMFDVEAEVRLPLIGHDAPVTCAVASPVGVLTACKSGAVGIWALETGLCMCMLQCHESPINSVSFSPSRNLLLTASHDGSAKLWDMRTGDCSGTLQGHNGHVMFAMFDMTESLVITASKDTSILVWSLETFKQISELREHNAAVTALKFSPNDTCLLRLDVSEEDSAANAVTQNERQSGAWVLTASDDCTVQLVDASTGESLKVFKGHRSRVRCACFSSDASLVLTASHDGTAKLWSVTSGKCMRTLRGHTARVKMAVFSSDDSFIVTASGDATARLWCRRTSSCLHVLQGHKLDVNDVSISKVAPKEEGGAYGPLVATASDDFTCKLWTLGGQCLQTLRGHRHAVFSCAFNANGAVLLSRSADASAKLWNSITGDCLRTFTLDCQQLLSATLSLDNSVVLTASSDGVARLWNVCSGACDHTLVGHHDWIRSATISVDGNMVVTASDDGTAKLWHIDDKGSTCEKTFRHPGGIALVSVILAPREDIILTCNKAGAAMIWDLSTGECTMTWKSHKGTIATAAFSP